MDKAAFFAHIRNYIGYRMVQIERMVGANYELTLLARHKIDKDAHILVTSERDWESIHAAINELRENGEEESPRG